MVTDTSVIISAQLTRPMIFERYAKAYLRQSKRIWSHLPSLVRSHSVGRAYGKHLHALVRRYAERNQNHSTFFLRNRPELALMLHLLEQRELGASVDITVVACSKGAEVYSILWKIRSARPDLKVRMRAVDISQDVVTFGEGGVYALNGAEMSRMSGHGPAARSDDMTWKDQIWGNQALSMFERMTDDEVHEMFELEGDHARIKSWLREGVTWQRGDATDREFAATLGRQDVVVANRFLCHMKPPAAEACLRNMAPLVKPGGYIFVSGVDLDVRTKVAIDLGWRPVTHMFREVHEGDTSLIEGWPLDYWGIEPFSDNTPDLQIRFASVFQVA
jgi:chemotaxis methyl-accepting protein methylase